MSIIKRRTVSIAALLIGIAFFIPGKGGAQDSWRTVRIETDEQRFVPDRITLKAGQPVKLEIKNIGNEEHEFRSPLLKGPLIEVLSNGVIVKSRDIHSIIVEYQSTATIKWLSPEPGEYHFECRIPSHHGMDGVITVK